jgi:hypothetical protein
MKHDHVGINVASLADAEAWYQKAFGLQREFATRIDAVGLAWRCGGAERGHGLVHGGGLDAVRPGERARRHDATRLANPARLTQRGQRIACELEGVYSGDRAEKIVRERKFLQIAEPQFGVGDAVAGGGQQAGADVQPGHGGAAGGGQLQQQAAAAACVEQPGPGGHRGRGEHRLEQRPGVRLGEPGPVRWVTSPQELLLAGGGAQRPARKRHHAASRGAMFWFDLGHLQPALAPPSGDHVDQFRPLRHQSR